MAGQQRLGKDFEKEWWTGMQLAQKELGGRVRVHRFYDLHDYVGKFCPRCRRSLDICGACGQKLPISKAQPPKQPSDFETIWKGTSILQELKSSHNPVLYEHRFVRPYQLSSLVNNEMAGGAGIFVFCNRSRPREIKTYAVGVLDYLSLIQNGNGRTVPWEQLEAVAFFKPMRERGHTIEGNVTKRYTFYDHKEFCKAVEGRKVFTEATKPHEKWGVLKADTRDCNKVQIRINEAMESVLEKED